MSHSKRGDSPRSAKQSPWLVNTVIVISCASAVCCCTAGGGGGIRPTINVWGMRAIPMWTASSRIQHSAGLAQLQQPRLQRHECNWNLGANAFLVALIEFDSKLDVFGKYLRSRTVFKPLTCSRVYVRKLMTIWL